MACSQGNTAQLGDISRILRVDNLTAGGSLHAVTGARIQDDPLDGFRPDVNGRQLE